MASMNKVILLGRLTRPPEIKYLNSGTAVTEFSLAVNNRIKRGDDWVDEVDYFDVATFGRIAETVGEYLDKGSAVAIEGRLKQSRWEAQDGTKRSKVSVVASNIQFLDRKGDSGSGQAFPSAASPATPDTWQGGKPAAPAMAPTGGQGDLIAPGDSTGYGDDESDIPFVRPDISDLSFDDRFRSDMRA